MNNTNFSYLKFRTYSFNRLTCLILFFLMSFRSHFTSKILLSACLYISGNNDQLILNMATNRSRFNASSYQIKAKHKGHIINQGEHGEDNINFANDYDGDIVDIDLDEIQNNEPDVDNFHVAFSKATSTVDITYGQDSTTTAEPFAADETEQVSDEEVAANVSTVDDPSMLVLTFRSWFLGLLFTCLLSFVNQFFWYRTSPLFVGTLVAQLLTYPLGKFMAKTLPQRRFRIFRRSFTLNPGPFTIKEHCIITAMANATCVIFCFLYKQII